MKIKDLKNIIDNCPDEMDIVLSKALLIDEDDEVVAVVDCPIVGTSVNIIENELELRFVLYSDDFKKCFGPEREIKLI